METREPGVYLSISIYYIFLVFSTIFNTCCMRPYTKESLKFLLHLDIWPKRVLPIGVCIVMSCLDIIMELTLLIKLCLKKGLLLSQGIDCISHLETPHTILWWFSNFIIIRKNRHYTTSLILTFLIIFSFILLSCFFETDYSVFYSFLTG